MSACGWKIIMEKERVGEKWLDNEVWGFFWEDWGVTRR